MCSTGKIQAIYTSGHSNGKPRYFLLQASTRPDIVRKIALKNENRSFSKP